MTEQEMIEEQERAAAEHQQAQDAAELGTDDSDAAAMELLTRLNDSLDRMACALEEQTSILRIVYRAQLAAVDAEMENKPT